MVSGLPLKDLSDEPPFAGSIPSFALLFSLRVTVASLKFDRSGDASASVTT